eukprot:1906178-Amphidinium_carterae.1
MPAMQRSLLGEPLPLKWRAVRIAREMDFSALSSVWIDDKFDVSLSKCNGSTVLKLRQLGYLT